MQTFNKMKNVAVIGAGTMGNGIAHVFAQFGYNVNLIDVSGLPNISVIYAHKPIKNAKNSSSFEGQHLIDNLQLIKHQYQYLKNTLWRLQVFQLLVHQRH